MTVRYYVKFNYFDTVESGRIHDSIFVDLPREITSNADLKDLKEQLDVIAANYIPNAKRLRISDYRLEGVSETAMPVQVIRENEQWKKKRARA